MRNVWIAILVLFVVVGAAIAAGAEPKSPTTSYTMLAKGMAGSFFPTAGNVAHQFNQTHYPKGKRITIQQMCSSAAIIDALMAGKTHLGAAHSQRIHQAYQGMGRWKDRPQKDLRTICNLHPEPIALLTFADSGIHFIQDIAGRQVYMGEPGCDLQYAAREILQAAGIAPGEIISAPADEAPQMLQDESVDAFFIILGTMRRPFHELVSGPRKLRLVAISGPQIDAWVANNPFYRRIGLETATYPYLANQGSVATIGAATSLITTQELSPDISSALAATAIQSLDDNKRSEGTAFFTPHRQLSRKLAAPIHPGATARFTERGYQIEQIAPE